MSRLWDISQRIGPRTPVWPGEPQPEISRLATISATVPVNVSLLALSVHTGTHADAPLHYDMNGEDSAESELAPYIGRCRVVDVRHAVQIIRLSDFDRKMIEDEAVERVIFRTFAHFPTDAWNDAFTAIDPSVIDWLASNGVRLIGTDAPSLDPQESKTLDAHMRVLAHDMRILEGLVLDAIEAGVYELVALPLKLAGSDASPVRAVLRQIL